MNRHLKPLRSVLHGWARNSLSEDVLDVDWRGPTVPDDARETSLAAEWPCGRDRPALFIGAKRVGYGPCPTCGSTNTRTEKIPIPMAEDVEPYPTIDGAAYCLDCEGRGLIGEVSRGDRWTRYLPARPE